MCLPIGINTKRERAMCQQRHDEFWWVNGCGETIDYVDFCMEHGVVDKEGGSDAMLGGWWHMSPFFCERNRQKLS